MKATRWITACFVALMVAPLNPLELSADSHESAAGAVVVVDHQPAAVIVLREDATELETIAAEDLAHYVAASTDAFLSTERGSVTPQPGTALVRIGIAGQSPFADITQEELPYQGFRIVCGDNQLDLIGSTMQGASNAVYWLLRNKLGVRWYMPSELGEEVPKQDSFVLSAFTVTKAPSFKVVRRATGRRPTLQRHGIRHYDTIIYVDESRRNIDYAFSHNWLYVVPLTTENKYKHPEWFSLLSEKEQNDQRAWDSLSGRRGYQVCTTHPEVIQQFVKAAKKQFTTYPKRKIFAMSPNDWQGYCHCQRCLALDKELGVTPPPYSDRIVYFINQVAEQLATEFPDKSLGLQAYSTHTAPPKVVKPHPMLIPILCPHGGRFCYRHPIDDPRCDKNKAWKSQYFDGWAKLCDELAFYGYWGTSGRWHGPMPTTADRELPFLRANKVRILTNNTNRSWATNAPYYYLFMRMAWETELDPESVYDEFCNMYGPAKVAMKSYWLAWNQAWDAASCRDWQGYHYQKTFTPQLIEQQWERIRAAEAAVAEAPERYQKRVELARVGLEYTDHRLAGMRYEKNSQYQQAESALNKAIATMVLGKSLSEIPAFSQHGEEYGWEDRIHGSILKQYRENAKEEQK